MCLIVKNHVVVVFMGGGYWNKATEVTNKNKLNF
jgi:hypothetical protein